MRDNDIEAFDALMRDLCAAYNRPYEDRLVRVFMEDLRSVPFGIVRAKAELHRRTAKRFPTPADLRPGKAAKDATADAGPSVEDQLTEFITRRYIPHVVRWAPAAMWWFSQPWTFLYREGEPYELAGHWARACTCVGVVIPACRGRPGLRVTVEDMQRDYLPPIPEVHQ